MDLLIKWHILSREKNHMQKHSLIHLKAVQYGRTPGPSMLTLCLPRTFRGSGICHMELKEKVLWKSQKLSHGHSSRVTRKAGGQKGS